MSNENTSIHEFDFEIICEYFSNLNRQGPGSPASTINALRFVGNLNNDSKIADLGCGTGGQTIVLAQNAPGLITGIDLFPRFIDLFNANVQKNNLQERINGITGSMDNLPFSEEELDLIWSEGAIYNIGFARGINYWKKFLKKGGSLALTEACWFTNERPEEIQDFWIDAYPEIDTIPVKIQQLQYAGYIPVATFVLPEICWTENFYDKQTETQKLFLEKYKGNITAEELVKNQRHEAELYKKYKAYYGYVFFIAVKL